MRRVFLCLLVVVLAFSVLSGCKQKEILKLENLIFCSEIRGDRDITEREGKQFSVDEVVYVYLEVSNFVAKASGGKYEYWPVVEVEVTDPNNNKIIQRTKVVDAKLETGATAPYLYFPINLTFPEESPKGKYRLNVYVSDMNSDRKIEAVDYFFIT